jgi:energy-coupling factor transport system ATP-binding protein
MEPGIELREVSFSFSPITSVLQDVNLSFRPGEFVGIVGPNASGKTTLARHLNGSLLPTAGFVSVDGLSSSIPENQLPLKRLVTVIHSDAENQLIAPTVWDEITFALLALGTDKNEIKNRCETALDTFGLRKYRDIHPFYLSVGEQFRLLLAAGFVRNPRYFVLDEVLSMLDAHTRGSLLQMLLSLRTQSGVGVVLLTHRLDDLVDADRIVVLQNGQVKIDGSVATVFREALERPEWNIEVPLIYRIYNSLNPNHRQRLAELSCRLSMPL